METMVVRSVDAVIFDVDGVIIDSPHERAWLEALDRLMSGPWAALAQQSGYDSARYTTAVYQQVVAGKPREVGAAAALAYFGIPDPDGQCAQQYAEAKQALLLELIDQRCFQAFDDAIGFMLRLKRHGVRLAAASSSRNANRLLSQVKLQPAADHATLSLLDLFDANVCGQAVAQGKPHPDLFLAASAALQVAAARCVVIEDAPAGVQAAKAAGMTCVAVARLDDQAALWAVGADQVVTSLAALDVAIGVVVRDNDHATANPVSLNR